MYNCAYVHTTSNIIIIGLSTKVLESGEGSIWSENMGETGTWDTVVLETQTQATVMAGVSNQLFWKHTYLLLEDGNLRPLISVSSILAIESSWEPVPARLYTTYSYVDA